MTHLVITKKYLFIYIYNNNNTIKYNMSPLFFRQNTLPVWERSYWTIPQSKNLKEKVPAFSHILFLFFLLQCLLFSYEMCKKKFDKKIYKTKRSITYLVVFNFEKYDIVFSFCDKRSWLFVYSGQHLSWTAKLWYQACFPPHHQS